MTAERLMHVTQLGERREHLLVVQIASTAGGCCPLLARIVNRDCFDVKNCVDHVTLSGHHPPACGCHL